MCFQICTNTNIYYAFNKWYDTNTTIKNNLFIFYSETKIKHIKNGLLLCQKHRFL